MDSLKIKEHADTISKKLSGGTKRKVSNFVQYSCYTVLLVCISTHAQYSFNVVHWLQHLIMTRFCTSNKKPSIPGSNIMTGMCASSDPVLILVISGHLCCPSHYDTMVILVTRYVLKSCSLQYLLMSYNFSFIFSQKSRYIDASLFIPGVT